MRPPRCLAGGCSPHSGRMSRVMLLLLPCGAGAGGLGKVLGGRRCVRVLGAGGRVSWVRLVLGAGWRLPAVLLALVLLGVEVVAGLVLLLLLPDFIPGSWVLPPPHRVH